MSALAEIQQAAFALLAEGVAVADSPWRTLVLATAGAHGPGLRSVVLRRLHTDARSLEFHTDTRAPKVAALLANPTCGLLGWDPARRIQFRITGTARLMSAAEADAAWAALGPHTRGTYAARLAPGTPITDPALGARDAPDDAARAHFCGFLVRCDELEWLHLAPTPHQRARFTWADGQGTATWLAP